MDIKEKIENITDDIIEDLTKLVKYNSELGEAKPGMPFGEGPAAVLKEALEIAERMGFETKNLDNYCGYAQMGEGKDIVGIVGHLDIVPVGEGWNTDPFTLENRDGVLYGRGVSDDKGGCLCALYAMKLIKDSGIALNKRVRLIFGCNEETGMECMKHYNEVEEPVTLGFTPDGSFPVIHGEKTHMAMTVTSKNTKIISMEGGFVSNAVCQRCKSVIPAKEVDLNLLKASLSESPLTDFTITENGDNIEIDAIGVSAHASLPLEGVNAAGYTMKALKDAGMQDDFVEYYNSHIGVDCDGTGYNLKISDDFGSLTLCNGTVKTKDNVITCTIDIRIPVTYTGDQVRALIADRLEDENGKCVIDSIGIPLFYPADSPLVKTLYDSYVKVTGDDSIKPMVIGGGTYAKAMNQVVAFGCEFPGSETHIHEPNECLKVEELKLQVEIYEEAIKNLLLV